MKRYMELVKAVLRYVEEHDDGDTQEGCVIPLTHFGGYSENAVRYHILLCDENELLNVCWMEKNPGSLVQVLAGSLTWEGHNALDEWREQE